jgi:hypothetical protein
MSFKGTALVAIAAGILTSSAISGYNPIISSVSAAQAAYLSSGQTQEKP